MWPQKQLSTFMILQFYKIATDTKLYVPFYIFYNADIVLLEMVKIILTQMCSISILQTNFI